MSGDWLTWQAGPGGYRVGREGGGSGEIRSIWKRGTAAGFYFHKWLLLSGGAQSFSFNSSQETQKIL